MINKQSWGEVVERIVIDYANLSGRESNNRAEFREKVREHISKLLTSKSEQMEFENIKLIEDTLKAKLAEQMERKKNNKDHICRFNDGEQNCDCYNAGIDVGIEILKK